ncbi:hypothetical protein BHM03_00022171 [Ensete ventricosum]|nr:hypothetical protein BHM03_00022171 [Ensete ventricosum]
MLIFTQGSPISQIIRPNLSIIKKGHKYKVIDSSAMVLVAPCYRRDIQFLCNEGSLLSRLWWVRKKGRHWCNRQRREMAAAEGWKFLCSGHHKEGRVIKGRDWKQWRKMAAGRVAYEVTRCCDYDGGIGQRKATVLAEGRRGGGGRLPVMVALAEEGSNNDDHDYMG